jgi:hypothetical protein
LSIASGEAASFNAPPKLSSFLFNMEQKKIPACLILNRTKDESGAFVTKASIPAGGVLKRKE